MFESARKRVMEDRMKILKVSSLLDTFENENMAELEEPGMRVWTVMGDLHVEVTDGDYDKLLGVLKKLTGALASPFRVEGGHVSSSGGVLFTWKSKDYPLEVWFRAPFDEIPEELMRGCKVKEIEVEATTKKVLACGV